MNPKRAVVVGAGVGGLVAALELACRGLEVVVIERAPVPGGKIREVVAGDALVDAGPTVFTMRWVFDEIFAGAGTRLEDHLALTPLDILARHAWEGGARLDLHADPERSAAAIGEFAGAAEARRFLAFCAHARDVYATLEQPFLRAPRGGTLALVRRAGVKGLPGMLRMAPFATMWNRLGRYFHDPRLRQLFGRYATYCGSSPYAAPATLMLIAHVEREGVWSIAGGMRRLADVLATLAIRAGAAMRYGDDVAEVLTDRGAACGVRLASGEPLTADLVVVNADANAVACGLLGEGLRGATRTTAPGQRSLSAVTWSLHAPTEGFPLLRHNVFFSADYAAEFDALFRHGVLPAAPTVYVCAQDRPGRDSAGAPPARERLLVLVNAPAVDGPHAVAPSEIQSCEDRTFSLLTRCGLTIHREPDSTALTTPADFARLFPGTGGALYGRATHGWRASFQRPGSRTRIPRLYLAGGSTHPGPGVPMAALSGRLAAASALADLASTRR